MYRTGTDSIKVAVVVGQFPALSETFVLNHITGLLDRGADVDILAVTALPQPTLHPRVRTYRLLERTLYAREEAEGLWRRRLHLLRLIGQALYRAPAAGVPLSRVVRHGRGDGAAALAFTHVANGKPAAYDIIHCHFGQYGRLGLALRNMGLLRGALVTTFHGYDMSRALVQSGPQIYDRLFAEGDLFLPVSDFWRQKLLDLGCPAERIVVHRMGVDLEQFSFHARSVPRVGPAHVLTVGRLTEKKGIEYGIRAVAEIVRAGRDITYSVVGDGPDRPALSRLIRDLGIGTHVQLLGSKNRREVASLMAQSQILLAPSVTASDGNQEGIPVVLMEAMATGLPVISSLHTGIPELVEHGVTGLLAEERDVPGLARQLNLLLDDPQLYRRLATFARWRVERQYDIERLSDRLVAIYEELIGDRTDSERRASGRDYRRGSLPLRTLSREAPAR